MILVLAPGSVLGPLTIHRLLGRGGMGEVYEAEQTALRRRVAVKRIADHLVEHPEARARFAREAQTIARLTGEHIVAVHEFGSYLDAGGVAHLLLVLELVEGGLSLRRVLAGGAVPWPAATSAIRQAALGLAAAEELGIVHRDIKPDNLLLTRKGVVKITDFGLAKSLDSTAISLSGNLVGTPAYLAPEACAGEPADARSDLYSLGATWFHLLTGRTPFVADSTLAMLKRHQQDPPPDVRDLADKVPADIAALVARLLRKAPGQRCNGAADLVAMIDALPHAIPRLVPELWQRSHETREPAALAPTMPVTPVTAAGAHAETVVSGLNPVVVMATSVPLSVPLSTPPNATTVVTADLLAATAPTVQVRPAARPKLAPKVVLATVVCLLLIVGLWVWLVPPTAPTATVIQATPVAEPELPAPPVIAAPAVEPAVGSGDPVAELDAALAEQRLGDAQRIAESLASRNQRPDKVAATTAAVRTAERGWQPVIDDIEALIDGQQWVKAHARLADLPADRILATRSVAERREGFATAITRGASAAFADARIQVQDQLDKGSPLMARHHLMLAMPLAQLAGKMPDWFTIQQRVAKAESARR